MRPAVRWGLVEAFGGLFVIYFVAAVAGLAIFAASGYDEFDEAPLWLFAVANAPLHLAMLAVVWWSTSARGNGMVTDLCVRVRPGDVGRGLVMGPVCSIGLGLLYLPIVDFFGGDADAVDDAARDLTDRANTPVGVVALVIAVVVLAPIAEEIFFRGFLLRAVEDRAGTTAGVIVSSVVFGAVHFQLLQLPILIALGLILAIITVRTERLGPAILTHMAFNGLTVVSLLAL